MNKLTDLHGRAHTYLRVSLTEACNFGCTYCVSGNSFPLLPRAHQMTAEEVFDIVRQLVEMGIRKVRFTGGEPLVRKDAADIFRKIAQLPIELALSTNGMLLHKHFDVLQETNIRHLNISLDTLNPNEFKEITRVDGFHQVMENIHTAAKLGFKVKLNAVAVRSKNLHDLVEFAELTKDLPIELRFIEFMPFTGNDWDENEVLSQAEILELLSQKHTLLKAADQPNDTAKHYQISGFKGKIGIISTVTQPFCDSCNRLRLTADGKLRNCLFAASETDLLTPYRNGESLHPLIRANVLSKFAQTGGQQLSSDMQNRTMISIGG